MTLKLVLPQGTLASRVESLDGRKRPDTQLLSEDALAQVFDKMVGDTGIEPVASSV